MSFLLAQYSTFGSSLMKQNLMKTQTAALVSYSYRLMISIIFYNSIIILVLLAFPVTTLNMIL